MYYQVNKRAQQTENNRTWGFFVLGGSVRYLTDVTAVDVLLQGIRIKRLTLRIIPRKPILRVRNIQSPIRSPLERPKHTTPCTRLAQPNVQVNLERPSLVLNRFSHGKGAVGLDDALIFFCQADFGEGTASDEEACCVGCCPVFEAMFDAVAREFGGVGCGKDDIALELGVDDLADLRGQLENSSRDGVRGRGLGTTEVFVKRTTRRYLGVAYLFFAWVMRRFLA
jgi:hypothetical protein